MFEIADRFETPFTIDPEVTPRDNGDRSPLDISASPDGLRRLIAVQSRRALKGNGGKDAIEREGDTVTGAGAPEMHCGAGSGGIAVDPYGNVFPCVQWRRPVGNLHERSLVEIWRRDEKLDEIRRVTTEAKHLVESWEGTLTGFCPGVAEMLTGDPLAVPENTATRSSILAELPLHPVP